MYTKDISRYKSSDSDRTPTVSDQLNTNGPYANDQEHGEALLRQLDYWYLAGRYDVSMSSIVRMTHISYTYASSWLRMQGIHYRRRYGWYLLEHWGEGRPYYAQLSKIFKVVEY